MTELHKLREQIANGLTEETLNELTTLTAAKNYELQNSIIQLRRRWSELNRAKAKNTISAEDASLEASKINDDILNLMAEMEGLKVPEPHNLPNLAQTASQPAAVNSSRTKNLLWMGAGALSLILLFTLIGTCTDDVSSESAEPSTPQIDADSEIDYTTLVGVFTVDAYLSEDQFYPITLKIEEAYNGSLDGYLEKNRERYEFSTKIDQDGHALFKVGNSEYYDVQFTNSDNEWTLVGNWENKAEQQGGWLSGRRH